MINLILKSLNLNIEDTNDEFTTLNLSNYCKSVNFNEITITLSNPTLKLFFFYPLPLWSLIDNVIIINIVVDQFYILLIHLLYHNLITII